MPDPTAHADDMKSPAVIEPNTAPALWWVNPWGYALSMKRALDAVYLLSETTEDAYKAATTVIKQKDDKVEDLNRQLKRITMFCENAGAERDREKQKVEEITLMVNDRDRQIDTRDKEVIRLTNLTRNLRRKLSKAEKAAGIKPAKKKGVRRA